MQAKAVFAADSHLSEATWTSRSQLRGDSFFGFRQVVDIAIREAAPLVLAGDCWELMHQPRPSSMTVEFVRSQLDRLQAAGLPFYYINGQHDQLASPYWFAAIHPWPTHVGGREFNLGDERWYGVDFFEASNWEHVVAGVPAGIDGLVVHRPWEELSGSALFGELRAAELPASRWVVSGDLHNYVDIEDKGRRYLSPGSTHMRTIQEPRDHYCAVYRGGNVLERESLLSRPVVDFEVYRPQDLLDGLEDLREQVTRLRDAFLERGGEPGVSTPLVVLSDHADCEAYQTLVTELPEATVVPRRCQVKGQSAEEQLEVDLDDVVDVRELMRRLAAERGMSPDAQELLTVLLRGEDLLAAGAAQLAR